MWDRALCFCIWAVVVREEGKIYYKLHRVFMPDGSIFDFQYEKRSNAETAGLHKANWSPTDITSINSIPQNSEKSTPETDFPFENPANAADRSANLQGF